MGYNPVGLIFKTLGIVRVEDIYKLRLLKLFHKNRRFSIPPYFYDFVNIVSNENQESQYDMSFVVRKLTFTFPKESVEFQLRQLRRNFDTRVCTGAS